MRPADGIQHCRCICCAFNARTKAIPCFYVLTRGRFQHLVSPFSRGYRETRSCLFFEHPRNCFFIARARACARTRARFFKGSIRKKICCTGSSEPPVAVDTGLVMTTSTARHQRCWQTRPPAKVGGFCFVWRRRDRRGARLQRTIVRCLLRHRPAPCRVPLSPPSCSSPS